MNTNLAITAYIEIEKHTNVKYEYCKKAEKLVVDRIIPYPFFYPYAYGFIPGTFAPDNDELDVLIITNNDLKNDAFYNVHIIGALLMEDEHGQDNKVLCVLEEDYKNIKNIFDLEEKTLNDLGWFFSNYKSSTPGKWSNVIGFSNASDAAKMYLQSAIAFKEKEFCEPSDPKDYILGCQESL